MFYFFKALIGLISVYFMIECSMTYFLFFRYVAFGEMYFVEENT